MSGEVAHERASDTRPELVLQTELVRLLSESEEANAFWRLRRKITLTSAIQALRHARLRVALVISLSLFFSIGLSYLFYHAFGFLQTTIGSDSSLQFQTVRAVFNVFFAALMGMLIVSSGIILYGSLYCTPESSFLHTLPVRSERLAIFKFQEAMFFSSWGFLLLSGPMLISYGAVERAPWHYYAMLLPFMLAFVYIPCALGAVVCLVLVDQFPRLRAQTLTLVIAAVSLALLWYAWRTFSDQQGNLFTPTWFHELSSRLKVSEHRLLPSWWLSSGLLEAARRDHASLKHHSWEECVWFLALLVSNALVAHLALVWVAEKTYRRGYSAQLLSDPLKRKPKYLLWLDAFILNFLVMLPRAFRLLIVKDLRIFRRDPVQWTQFLIFFGLLGLYFINIRRFSYESSYLPYVNMVSFLNLAVVGLILSTFTTRFIYPLVSLEGHRIWILGLLPIKRDTIVWSKFFFAAIGSSIPCMLLILLSDIMLQVGELVVKLHQATCLMLCWGLAAIAVGLGACMPNFRESSPSKIAAGFGGTLNLVLSAMYIVALVLLTALPCHFLAAIEAAREPTAEAVEFARRWLLYGFSTALVIGMFTLVVPMAFGLRAFRKMEF